MNKLALSKDKRCESRRIRLVDRKDPHFRQISKSRIPRRNGVQKSVKMGLDSNDISKKCITLADCDEFLSTGLCFYDEGEAACFSPPWFVVLNPMEVQRWKCAAVLLKETQSYGTCADYVGLLETYQPDWRQLYGRRADLEVTACIIFVSAECMYGGLHALAWSSDFRTAFDKHLWRFAVVFIIAFGPVAMIVIASLKTCFPEDFELLAIQESIEGSMQRSRDAANCTSCCVQSGSLPSCGNWGHFSLWICSIEVVARIILVVGCLIALFNSVPGVFEEPSWSAYFPHTN